MRIIYCDRGHRVEVIDAPTVTDIPQVVAMLTKLDACPACRALYDRRRRFRAKRGNES